MIKKAVSLWLMGTCLIVFDACCPDARPYTNFSSIEIDGGWYDFGDLVSIGMNWTADEVEYIAHTGVASTAMAYSCEKDGEYGLKNPIVGITVVSTTNWSDTYPAGASLNDFVDYSPDPLSVAWEPLSTADLSITTTVGWVRFRELGDSGYPHRFTILLTKEDGQVVSGQSQSFTW